jgi:hypothetical protein
MLAAMVFPLATTAITHFVYAFAHPYRRIVAAIDAMIEFAFTRLAASAVTVTLTDYI